MVPKIKNIGDTMQPQKRTLAQSFQNDSAHFGGKNSIPIF
jgi:hypothetical protein